MNSLYGIGVTYRLPAPSRPETGVVDSISHPYTSSSLSHSHPDWHFTGRLASKAVAKVIDSTGNHLSCGFLVGVDRLLVPAHVVAGGCSPQFTVIFAWDDPLYQICYHQAYSVSSILEVNYSLDYCILHLAPNSTGHAGEFVPIPDLSCNHVGNEFLFAHADVQGKTSLSIGKPCGRQDQNTYFCALSSSMPGSSGGGYFNADGSLFAIHLARSSGRCGCSKDERRALFIQDIVKHSKVLRTPSRQFIPQRDPNCMPQLSQRNICYINEKRPAMGVIPITGGGDCKFWEVFSGNGRGPGPRGIRIAAAKAFDVTYQFVENPHQWAWYNNNGQDAFYQAATRAFWKAYRNQKDVPPSAFQFAHHNQTITAKLV